MMFFLAFLGACGVVALLAWIGASHFSGPPRRAEWEKEQDSTILPGPSEDSF